MHHRLQSSVSFRLVFTKASSLVRNNTPSSSTMPQRPPCFKVRGSAEKIAPAWPWCGTRIWVFATALSFPPKGGSVRITSNCEGRGEEPAIHFVARQCVAVPDVRLVDSVQDQVGQRDGVDQVLFLAAPRTSGVQLLEIVAGQFCSLSRPAMNSYD